MLEPLCNFTATERAILTSWLRPALSSSTPNYFHVHISEDITERENARPLVQRYLTIAHADAISYFRRFYSLNFDPRGSAILDAALANYPAEVERLTLAGFFGEVMASLVAELVRFHSLSWLVPALCFRHHATLFRQLMGSASRSEPPKRSLGRTGDDCVGFAVDSSGSKLEHILLCEAKCSYDHNPSLIADGHKQLSDTALAQLELFRITTILQDRNDATAQAWLTAIGDLVNRKATVSDLRYDFFFYAYGRPPKQSTTWLSPSSPHANHGGKHPLIASEAHFSGCEVFVRTIYREAFTNV